MAALAREVLADLQSRHAGAANVRLQVDPLLPTLMLDPTRIRLLLRNLLDNTLRHSATAAHPPELHLTATGPQSAVDTPGIELTVRDHGHGVRDDQLAHLTEPLFRLDTERTRAQGGVGLGLHLNKLVVLAQGGTLELCNAMPGLAIRVRLPCK